MSQLEYAIGGPEDLPKATVGTIQYTTSEIYLKTNFISYILFNTASEGLKAIEDGAINALVFDAPLLQYFANKDYKEKIEVPPKIFFIRPSKRSFAWIVIILNCSNNSSV